MAIQVTCSGCGRQYSVADELAGTRCQCTACGGQVAVPARSRSPGAAPIRFSCPHCSQPFAVPAELGGTSAQCNRCGNVVLVPGAAGLGPLDALTVPALPNLAVPQFAPGPQVAPPTAETPWAKYALIGTCVLGGVALLGLILVIVVNSITARLSATPQLAEAPGNSAPPAATSGAGSPTAPPSSAGPSRPTTPGGTAPTPKPALDPALNPRPRGDELDPQQFPEVQLDWRIGGSPPDADFVETLRRQVAAKLQLRGVRVVPNSNYKMVVEVQPGAPQTVPVRVWGITGASNPTFNVTVPSHNMNAAYLDGARTVWSRKRSNENVPAYIPQLVPNENPQAYMQDQTTRSRWGEVRSFIADAVPFPLSQQELDQIAADKAKAERNLLANKKRARNELATKVSWSVKPEPETSTMESGEPIRLDTAAARIAEVQLWPAAGGRVLVLSEAAPNMFLERHPAGKVLDVYQTVGGSRVGHFEFDAPRFIGGLSDDGLLLVTAVENRIEVHTLDGTAAVRTWQLEDFERVAWLRVVHDLVLTRSDTHELTAWALANGQKKYAIPNIELTHVGPNGKYVLVREKNGPRAPGHLYEVASGNVAGNLERLEEQKNHAPSEWAFSPDGTRLVASAPFQGHAWDLTTGKALPNVPRLNGGPPFDYVTSQLLVCGNNLCSLDATDHLWSVAQSDRHTAVSNGYLWFVVAPNNQSNAYLAPVPVSEEAILNQVANSRTQGGRVRTGNTYLTYEEAMKQNPIGVPKAASRTLPRLGGFEDSGADPRQSAANYATYMTAILADDQKVSQQMKWLPGAKRMTLGERWAVGVVHKNSPKAPAATSFRDFERLAGDIGTAFVAEMNKRAVRGDFGAWSAAGFSQLGTVSFIPNIVTTAELRTKAQEHRFQMLAVFELTATVAKARQTDTTLTVQIVDLCGRKEAWTSRPIRNSQLRSAKERGEDSVTEFVATLLKKIDAEAVLAPLPEITAEVAQKRTAGLAQTATEADLPTLAEVRYYQAKKLVDAPAAVSVYARILGADTGPSFATGTPTERQQLLRKWLKSAP